MGIRMKVLDDKSFFIGKEKNREILKHLNLFLKRQKVRRNKKIKEDYGIFPKSIELSSF
jgi:hypothetical protein